MLEQFLNWIGGAAGGGFMAYMLAKDYWLSEGLRRGEERWRPQAEGYDRARNRANAKLERIQEILDEEDR